MPQTVSIILSASADAESFGGELAQSGASARLDEPLFADMYGRLVSGVTYSLVEGAPNAVPEPPNGLLLLGVLVFFCRMNRAREAQ